MPPQRPLECPWCEVGHADGDSFRVHLMVEHRKSELAALIEEYVTDDAAPEMIAR